RSAPGTSRTRFRTPVATRAESNWRLPPWRKVTVISRGSTRCTVASSRISIPCSSHHPGGRTKSSSAGSSPRRYALDNPGRSYGACGSSPGMIRRPSKPDPRSVAAAVAPVSDAPTMTKVRSATEASGLDLDLTVLLANAVGLDRLARRTFDDLAGLHGEHASVAFALDRRPVDLPAHRQVAVTVRADVAERVQRRARTRHRDLGALHLERLRRALLDVAGRGDRDELRHRSLLVVVVRSLRGSGRGRSSWLRIGSVGSVGSFGSVGTVGTVGTWTERAPPRPDAPDVGPRQRPVEDRQHDHPLAERDREQDRHERA